MSYKLTRNIGRNHSSRASYGHGSKILSITCHHWGGKGQKFRNVVDWLRGYTGNRGSSAHYVVQDGLVEQIVEDSRASWHGGSNKANGTSIGIEMRPEMTDGDWATLVELCVNLERKHGSLKYYGHKDWKNTACPGDYYPRLGELVDAVNAYHKTGKVPEQKGGGGSSGGGDRSYETVAYGVTLGRWDKGDPVKDWQDFLVSQGYDLGEGEVDGYFGKDTEEPTEAFQKKHGLVPDGLAGDKTIAKAEELGLEWTRKPKSKTKPSESKAPNFPLPRGHWMGVESSNPKNHSGYYAKDRAGIKQWQRRMRDRGWGGIGAVDGLFGAKAQKVAKQFQRQVGIAQDGLVGEVTFEKSWSAPIT